jgi:hypothetical protein
MEKVRPGTGLEAGLGHAGGRAKHGAITEKANTSSQDLVMIADFDGILAELYGRLRRTMQRWCVEACTEFGWEIPFTQLVLHQPEAAG